MTALCAVSVNFLYHCKDILHRRLGQNAMTKVENVSRASCDPVQNIASAATDFSLWREKRHRIKIALNRKVVTQHFKGIVDRDTPVDTNHLGSRLLDRWQ